MNKLTGALLHICFELGPFEQKQLVKACLAFPRLARFWMASRNRTQGWFDFPIFQNTPHGRTTGSTRYGLFLTGVRKMHGLAWNLHCARHSGPLGPFPAQDTNLEMDPGTFRTCYLTLYLHSMSATWAIWNLTFPWGFGMDPMDLGSIMAYAWQIPDRASISTIVFHGICAFTKEDTVLKEYLSKPLFLDLPEARSALAKALDLYKKTTPERLLLFEVLASKVSEIPINERET